MAPVLMACWGIGRLLGPQLMVAGGGHPTHQWFGMYYAGQAGKRLPVPIFQAIEDFTIFGILLLVERWLRTIGARAVAAGGRRARPGPRPAASGGHRPRGGHGAVGHRAVPRRAPVAGRGRPPRLAAGPGRGDRPGRGGMVLLATRLGPLQRWRRGEGGDPAPAPSAPRTAQSRSGPVGAQDDGTGAIGRGYDGADPSTPVPSTAPSRASADD